MKAAAYRRRASEHSLQKQVLACLSLSKHAFAFAVPNAGKRSPATAVRMKAEGLVPGIADLCVMLPGGRVGWLELKTAKGAQSLAQTQFEDICEVLRHPYAVARSLDEAIRVLRAWGALK